MSIEYRAGMVIIYSFQGETLAGEIEMVDKKYNMLRVTTNGEPTHISFRRVLSILGFGDIKTPATPVQPVNREFLDLHAQLHALNVERYREHMIDVALASRDKALFEQYTQTT